MPSSWLQVASTVPLPAAAARPITVNDSARDASSVTRRTEAHAIARRERRLDIRFDRKRHRHCRHVAGNVVVRHRHPSLDDGRRHDPSDLEHARIRVARFPGLSAPEWDPDGGREAQCDEEASGGHVNESAPRTLSWPRLQRNFAGWSVPVRDERVVGRCAQQRQEPRCRSDRDAGRTHMPRYLTYFVLTSDLLGGGCSESRRHRHIPSRQSVRLRPRRRRPSTTAGLSRLFVPTR